jgi:glycosyltransferase involved in cell wall biosynthesis
MKDFLAAEYSILHRSLNQTEHRATGQEGFVKLSSIINKSSQYSKPVACMVSHSYYSSDARIKNYVGALLKKGYEIDVFALGDDDSLTGVNFIRVQDRYYGENALRFIFSYLSFFIRTFCLLTSGFLKKRYRFIHVHNIPNFLVFVAIIPKLLGAKVILDVHDTMPEHFATRYEMDLGHPLVKCLEAEELLSGAFADLIITTNDLHKLTLVSRGHEEKKIAIIMNLGNPRIFYPKHKAADNHAASGNLTLAYHGTIARRLGIDLIIEAVSRSSVECPGLRLLLIGEGEFMYEVKSLIEIHAIQDRVILTGWVPVELLPEYLDDADVGVIGNRFYTEVRHNWMLPVKMLQYAAMEIPTIAPRLKVIERYFDDTNAMFYDPDNVEQLTACIKNLYHDKSKISFLKLGLRRFNTQYNWELMENKYIDLVQNFMR